MQNIDISSAQNVTITYELANLRDRMLGALIDLAIVGIAYFFFSAFLISIIGSELDESFNGWAILFPFGPILTFTLYHFLSELFMEGQSIGKKVLRLKVIRRDGRDAGMSEYLMRAVLMLIDGLLSAGLIGIMLISSSGKKQRLGDMAANTVVIQTSNAMRFRLEDIEQIETLESYTPNFPDVRMYSEEDMLFIKSFIERFRKFPNTANHEALTKLVGKLSEELELEKIPTDKITFLKTLIKDYIVLTR